MSRASINVLLTTEAALLIFYAANPRATMRKAEIALAMSQRAISDNTHNLIKAGYLSNPGIQTLKRQWEIKLSPGVMKSLLIIAGADFLRQENAEKNGSGKEGQP